MESEEGSVKLANSDFVLRAKTFFTTLCTPSPETSGCRYCMTIVTSDIAEAS